MTYVVLGIATLVILLGGGKKLLARLGLNTVNSVILLLLVLIGSIIPAVPLSNRVAVGIGGALFCVVATAVGLFNGTVKKRVYVLYISLLLGIFFFVLARLFSFNGVGLFDDFNIIYILTVVLSVMLFCSSSYMAIAVAALSLFIAQLLWCIARESSFVLFVGRDLLALIAISIGSTILVNVVRGFMAKLYPRGDFILCEAAEFYDFEDGGIQDKKNGLS